MESNYKDGPMGHKKTFSIKMEEDVGTSKPKMYASKVGRLMSVAVLVGSQGGPWPPQIFITQKHFLYVLTIRKVFISTCISEIRGENEETSKAT